MTTPRVNSRFLIPADSVRHSASSYWCGCASTSPSIPPGSAAAISSLLRLTWLHPRAGFQCRAVGDDGAVADHGVLHAHAGPDTRTRTADRVADERVPADDHAVVEHRALDRGIRPDAAVRADNRMRPDVRAVRDRAVVDDRTGLIAIG